MVRKPICILIAAVFGLAALSTTASGADYAALERQRWAEAKVNPGDIRQVDQLLAIFERNKARYETVSHYGKRPIPAIVIFCLHYRESDASFRCHASNGDPLDHRTHNVPKGRLPAPSQPVFKWEDTAIDAYYKMDALGDVNWSDIGTALHTITLFNGGGYDRKGVPSAYTWARTTAYRRGKYVSDGRYDPYAVDTQVGCAAILKRFFALHPESSFISR